MIAEIKKQISAVLASAGVSGEIELSQPPKPEMGDFAFACFALAKTSGKNPAEAAQELAQTASVNLPEIIIEVKAFGPYVNFFINSSVVAKLTLNAVREQGEKYGAQNLGAGQKIAVEFSHPNTHKMFHIGHLRNIITGESIVRILENAGYEMHRINYQGDVGLHIAKSLWGIQQNLIGYENAKSLDIDGRVAFLGQSYALGGTKYEEDEAVKQAIIAINNQIYSRDPAIWEMYQTTRVWSLEYFDKIYNRVGTKFERLYFESEVYERGAELVREYVNKGVFKVSDGATIFAGSEHGLHDRVFINSQGFPTYEGKEVGLAELQFKEYNPDKIIHITGQEQAEYFKVVFAAIAQVFSYTAGKEQHLTYGWVRLKQGKMSSRTGQVVLGEWLLDEVEKSIAEVMIASEIDNKEEVIKRVGIAAVKYSMLKIGVTNELVFDFDESVSITGNSGPYLLYTIARINSIIKKIGVVPASDLIPAVLQPAEKKLVLALAEFPEATKRAAVNFDPSQIGQYLFDLAQTFSTFYHDCPVSGTEPAIQAFRLELITAVAAIQTRGLKLLGIETVEKM